MLNSLARPLDYPARRTIQMGQVGTKQATTLPRTPRADSRRKLN